MKRPKRPKKIYGSAHWKVRAVMRDLCEKNKHLVIKTSRLAEMAMKRLALPTSNPEHVYLFETALIQIAGQFLRHLPDPPGPTPVDEDGQPKPQSTPHLSPEFDTRLQDSYAWVRDGELAHIPREQLRPEEFKGILAKLHSIGLAYFDHENELRKIFESRFPEEAAS
jgi:hypothetical protein